jgi:hypothetical protein
LLLENQKETCFMVRRERILGCVFAFLVVASTIALGGCAVSTGDGSLMLSIGAGQGVGATEQDRASAQSTRTNASSNNPFSYSVSKDTSYPGMDVHNVKISYRGSVVAEGACFLLPKEKVVQLFENTPKVGCKTIIACYHSGGAHDDAGWNIAINSGSGDYLYEGSGLGCPEFEDVDGDGIKELPLYRELMLVYDKSPTLTFAETPGVQHYVVWTPAGLKNTVPGELSNVYTKLMNEALKDKGRDYGGAVMGTYYAIMSGQDIGTARKILENKLPNKWKPFASKILADIQKEISSSNFETVSLTPVTKKGSGRK